MVQIPILRSRGYRVVAPDLRGAGATDKPQAPDTYALRSMVADVAGKEYHCYNARIQPFKCVGSIPYASHEFAHAKD